MYSKKNIKNGQPDQSWFCHDIKIKILNKDKLYKKWKRLSSKTNFISLANIKKEIKKLIRQAKRKEEIRIADLSKENPKSFFSYVNNRKP